MFYINGLRIFSGLELQNFTEVEKLFYINRSKLGVNYDFKYLISNTHLFIVYRDTNLVGCIYYFYDNQLDNFVVSNFKLEKGVGGPLLYMNGFSERKTLNDNILVIKKTAQYYQDDIYSLTKNKAAVYCLLKSGYREVLKKENVVSVNKFRLFKLNKIFY